MLDALRDSPDVVQLAVAAAFAPALLAALARLRGRELSPNHAFWLLLPPLAVLAVQAQCTHRILSPPGATKLDPRAFAFLEATVAMVVLGPALSLAALAAALSRTLRPGAIAALPGALALAAWSAWILQPLRGFAWASPAAKVTLWAHTLAIHGGFALLVVVACAASAWRAPGPARLLALAPLAPLVCWPGWAPLAVLAEPVAGAIP